MKGNEKMSNVKTVLESLNNGGFDRVFATLYGESALPRQKKRYADIVNVFEDLYKDGEIRFFSAPGRTEVCGNHTDHNRGRVLAAAVNLDVIAAASENDENIIRLKSVEYPKMDVIDLNDLEPKAEEAGKSAALIRGVASRLKQLGYNIGGFNAVTTTDVFSGSGISSSAAFEVLVGTILNHLYNDGKISPVEIAKTAQFAENKFFLKPCGLMDQMACSVGGFVGIDFKDTENPIIEKVSLDFNEFSHALCIIDTGGDHSDLTDEYAAIRKEMESVAAYFGKSALRDVNEDDFYNNLDDIRKKTSERAVLRAMHFFNENKRVEKALESLKSGDFNEFKSVISNSGLSSYMYNQNVYSNKNPLSQPVSLALALCEKLLYGKGAYRVHGGGFAGTVQAFVPNELLSDFKSEIEKVFGENRCFVLKIREQGGTAVNP